MTQNRHMLNKPSLIIFLSAILSACNPTINTKDIVVGKWELIEPIDLNPSISITQMNCELTEKGNAFKKVTITINGIDTEADEVGKYEVDGDRVIWDNGTVFTLSEDGKLVTEQILPSMPNKKFILKLRKL